MRWLCLGFLFICSNLYSQFIDSINISCKEHKILKLRQDSLSKLEYHWYTDGGYIENSSDNTIWLNLVSEEKRRVTVSVWGYDSETTCSTGVATLIILLDECINIFIPTAFTPNNDGINDEYKPIGNWDGVTSFNFSIFNRWGENIFTSKTIDFKWDGTHNGVPCHMGVYVYYMVVEKNGVVSNYKGDIILIR